MQTSPFNMEKESHHKQDGRLKRLAIVKKSSQVGETKNPSMYQLKLEQIHCDEIHKIRKMAFGKAKKSSPSPEKVILVTGATGAGKTTLINTMINYILGVEYTDDFRFLLVQVEGSESQAKSQTKWVTSYTIHHQDFFFVPYTVTIVDTPGFADTEGIMRDKEIFEQLRLFFSTPGKEGIDHIDGVGFVTQACLPRLTPAQRYVFDSILALFGKDIADNIHLLITFADATKPPVLAAANTANVPFTKSFKFNSAAVFCSNIKTPEDSDEDEEDSFSKLFWKLAINSCTKYFQNLCNLVSKSLGLTQETLNERTHLEALIQALHAQTTSTLNQINCLKVKKNELQKYEAEVDRSKNYTYEVPEETVVQEEVPQGYKSLNCLECNFTCHYPCLKTQDVDKISKCVVMSRRGRCEACPKRCRPGKHQGSRFRIVREVTNATKMVNELKIKCDEAVENKESITQIIEKVQSSIETESMKALVLTERVKQSLVRLQEIALRPGLLSNTDYIDILIKAEQDGVRSGWEARIEQLEYIRTKAELVGKMANSSNNIVTIYERIARKEEEAAGSDGENKGATECNIWIKVFDGLNEHVHQAK